MFIAELFISESKSQVYGVLHDFLRTNPDDTKDISTYVIEICPFLYLVLLSL